MSSTILSLISPGVGLSPLAIKVQSILNVGDNTRWKNAICRIVQSTPYWSLISKCPEDSTLRATLPIQQPMPEGYTIVPVAGNYGAVKPAYVQKGLWPYLPELTIEISSDTTLLLTYGGKKTSVASYRNGTILVPEWPEDTGIIGGLKCPKVPTPGTTITIPTMFQYPVEDVVNYAGDNADVYTMLEKHSLTDAFYFADSADEKLSVIVLGLSKEFDYVI